MEPAEAQIVISLPPRLTLALCSVSEGAKMKSGRQGVREMWVIWSQSNMGWWPGLMVQEGLKDSSRQCMKPISFQSAFQTTLQIEGSTLDSCNGYKSLAFPEDNIQATERDDKYICNYSHTPVWLVHLLLGCFHVKFFIIMTFQFGILKFHLCPFSSVTFQ